ncbi:oligopeptidase A [Maricurvus nonylphenolicus]|uniref:oligopeptidase A n=1 Tax=Maricurvus nonylphenolicus TaxID=1008307 RepID=UPI0036F23A80
MNNPLLEDNVLPAFDKIDNNQIEDALDARLNACRQQVESLVDKPVTWDSLVAPLEEVDDLLAQTWSPVGHLNAVMNSDELRDIYTRCLSKLTEYSTEMGQHQGLYQAYQQLADSDEYQQLNQAQKQAVDNALRDFRLAGVALPEAKKQRYAEIKKRLSELSTNFSNNVLDATQGWTKLLDSDDELAGMPDTALEQAQQAAKDQQGYLLTLNMPSYLAVMMHADNRELREEVYTAFSTRASDQGPQAGKWDNAPLIEEILSLRHELAQLLEFGDYSERSLATKMAEEPQQVIDFLQQLAEKSKPQAEQELAELAEFSKTTLGIDELQPWDVTYCGEKLRQQQYSISEEALRPYFPVEKVIEGLFAVTARLFGISFEKEDSVATWHPDASYYQVHRDGKTIAGFYFDLFARENKRGGAWMDDCRVRRLSTTGEQQLPIAYLTCNFTPPVGDTPSLLTHNEVTTLFHEFGHGLHHMLTEINVAAVSGINGVAWDAVELPSQFLENWCWEKDVIPLISGHYQTGEPLPGDMLDNLLAAKNFQSAMMMVRQLEFALFDFLLHRQYDPQNPESVQAVLDRVRQQVAVIIPPAFNRFQNGFSHIFAGGYAAGYYSYKWAEVLSADAYSRFEEEGIFSPEAGSSFLSEILQQGGSKPAMDLFKAFRGREPQIDALLRHSGIQG